MVERSPRDATAKPPALVRVAPWLSRERSWRETAFLLRVRWRALLRRRTRFDFDQEVAGLSRVEIAVAFLALLELRKQNEIAIAQAGPLVRVPVFLIANLGQAIPGIGLLVLLFAFLGLGVAPTVIALVVYGLLPVLRNTVAGVQGVDPSVVDAARGMGMTRWQALARVQLPLASPLVFAGLRTALVLIIGTATLGNFIGGGGLGDVIAAGINNSDRMVFVGAVMVASLALLADWGLSMIERIAVPRQVNG